jgi:hypothetical protein
MRSAQITKVTNSPHTMKNRTKKKKKKKNSQREEREGHMPRDSRTPRQGHRERDCGNKSIESRRERERERENYIERDQV